MTAKDEISRTLWHLHSGLITQVEAEKIIFPIIDDLITDAKARSEVKARAEGAEGMKEAIRKEAVDEHWGSIGEDVRRVCTVPASILAPKEADSGNS